MKRLMALALGLVLAMAGSTAVEAQLGGLLKKKAGEVLGGKKAPPAPATPAPGTGTPAPSPSSPSGGDTAAVEPDAAKTAVSPLEESALPVRPSADQVLRDRIQARDNGDWAELPYIPAAAVAAAYALDEAAQIALVNKVGAALKAMVMSDTFASEHNAYIKSEHKAVNHGLTDVMTIEDALKKNDLKSIEAMTERQQVAILVDLVQGMPADSLKQDLDQQLADWKKNAANTQRRDRAKFQKLVSLAGPIEGLLQTDEAKFRRGYAVLKSIDNDGPDTESAVFAAYERAKKETEQAAWDQHNLKGQLKRQLSSFVTIASKVDFGAETIEKGGKTLFTNAAYERQGALWKACFRAGQAPTAAAVAFAKAWLAEF
jgi:hypothetical protein